MLAAVLEPAAAIADLAEREAAGTGRPSRLQDRSVVASVLEVLGEGRSYSAAARAAGVTEGAIRRWLSPAGRPARACRELQTQIAALTAARMIPPALPTPPPVAVPALNVNPPAPPKPAPAPPPVSVVVRWWHRHQRAAALRVTDPWESDRLLKQNAEELHSYGLSWLPPEPERWLPAGLSHGAICAAYVQWRVATGQGGPTDRDVETYALPWYQAHVLPGNG